MDGIMARLFPRDRGNVTANNGAYILEVRVSWTEVMAVVGQFFRAVGNLTPREAHGEPVTDNNLNVV